MHLYSLFFTLFITMSIVGIVNGIVIDITRGKLKSLLQQKKFVLIYFTRTSCLKCNHIFPKFLAASQSFDKDVIFAKVDDKTFSHELGAKTVPAFGYFTPGNDTMGLYTGDIVFETAFNIISDKMGDKYRYKIKQFIIDLNQWNFHAMTAIPRLNKLVLLHDNVNGPYKVYEKLAQMYKDDYEILFLKLDVKRERDLRFKFEMVEYPLLYWYNSDDASTKMRYGGDLSHFEELKGFIEDITGLMRKESGDLADTAGLIKEMDKVIEDHAMSIKVVAHIGKIRRQLIDISQSYTDNEYAHYYVYLFDLIYTAEKLAPLREEKLNLDIIISEGPGPKLVEHFLKKRNIVSNIIGTLGNDVDYGLQSSRFVMPEEQKIVKEFEEKEKTMLNQGFEEEDEDKEVTVETRFDKVTIDSKHHRHEEL